MSGERSLWFQTQLTGFCNKKTIGYNNSVKYFPFTFMLVDTFCSILLDIFYNNHITITIINEYHSVSPEKEKALLDLTTGHFLKGRFSKKSAKFVFGLFDIDI